ncbi:hypothetical protein IFM89_021915 [Coptis chinensis]|uniref:Uncharacterized protein n=1 Tax=Coptis chinensis TaxID=261450 RepID=A0A835HCD3_9MAGN|nr:hypothetical protein IFM89_021915 [Coptis chinensis]
MENNLRTTLSKKCGLTKVLVALFKKCAYVATHKVFKERMAELLNIGGDLGSNFLSRAHLMRIGQMRTSVVPGMVRYALLWRSASTTG